MDSYGEYAEVCVKLVNFSKGPKKEYFPFITGLFITKCAKDKIYITK